MSTTTSPNSLPQLRRLYPAHTARPISRRRERRVLARRLAQRDFRRRLDLFAYTVSSTPMAVTLVAGSLGLIGLAFVAAFALGGQ